VHSHGKYHCGWIWFGVINGLASAKFSGSCKIMGVNRDGEQITEP